MTAAPSSPHWPLPRWIAHRGAGRLAPENTLAAFRVGASHGWRAFECDVKLSADGVPFLLHDATLNRTTNAHGIAGERAWAELSLLDAGSWHGRTWAGEPLPSLQALARLMRASGFALDLEIKPTPGTERRTGEVVGRETRRLWGEDLGQVLFSSFSPQALEGARDTAPEVPRALLVDTLWAGWFETARELGCAAVITNYTVMQADVLQRLHDAGLRGLVYTVNDPSVAGFLIRLGIDGLITDALDRFAPGG